MKRNRVSALVGVGAAIVVMIVALGLLESTRGSRAEEGTLLRMPTFPPTPTIGQAPPDTQARGSKTLFADSFASDSSLSNWSFEDLADVLPEDKSVWTITEGQLQQSRTGLAATPSEQETIAVTGKADWTNYVISAKVYDFQNATFGLVVRRQGNSFYRYRAISDVYEDTPKHILEKVVNGVATPLATLDGPGYSRRQWHTVSMSAVGSTITVQLDGKRVLQATDTTLASGQAGLYTRAFGGIRFDDVTIAQP